jgi:hypothetical protein
MKIKVNGIRKRKDKLTISEWCEERRNIAYNEIYNWVQIQEALLGSEILLANRFHGNYILCSIVRQLTIFRM